MSVPMLISLLRILFFFFYGKSLRLIPLLLGSLAGENFLTIEQTFYLWKSCFASSKERAFYVTEDTERNIAVRTQN